MRTDPFMTLHEHLKKLDQYRQNPDSMDNLGHLTGNPDKRQKIIDGRLKNLQKQIDNFKKQLAECEKKNS